ncbi:hypothetical protein B0H67DRAFT_552690 [Lasiosphaeris hirsuta]|uniref:Uncharacterized protein n=1 Tax=Lasiosphaeris hirsuta TaxID=260670 RepID=A0AA40E0K8_9PEZI|nr:hypothetical protein B0H67DRAFT_552690 [Lasiosphaeris hirsuta]
MKSSAAILLALLHLATAQSTDTPGTISWTAAPPFGTGVVATGDAICGQGFTYCGYILRDHQKFPEEDIVKAYCAGNPENCADGKTKSDPIQALYVCLPSQPNSKRAVAAAKPAVMIKGRQAASGVSTGTTPISTSFWSSTGANGVGGGNSCSSTATTGNRIELLCSCGNQCLNPSADHIGRCDVPCS